MKPIKKCFFGSKREKMTSIFIVTILVISVIASIGFVRGLSSNGYISIAFDDATQSQFDYAYPLLQERDINATYYAISSYVGSANYMNSSALLTLQNSGSEIGSHSNTHAAFSYLSDNQLQQETTLHIPMEIETTILTKF
jgi:peptidoglycan/xylan/chitin deacetylase (PgdA/CDA1 family)